MPKLVSEMNKEQSKRSDLEILREENASLKTQLEAKENEIQYLKAELLAYKAIQESQSKK